MSRYMENTFGTYPMYPSKWDETLTSEQNLEAETYEPSYSSSFSRALDVDDSTVSGETVSTSQPYDMSDYPDWYQPKVLDRMAVIENPFNWRPYFSEPDINDVVCQTSDHSSLYDDCVRAFGSIESSDLWNTKAPHGTEGQKSWVVSILI
jgi:hypothetical protein